jgi:5-methylcytosine-specific restriction endonuclease McrA
VTRRSAVPRSGRPYRRLQARVRREHGVCAICGQPIDPELASPHPMSFSLDHITPVSMGGSLTDRDNARAAHRVCNARRGNGRTTPRPVTPGDRSASW